MSAPLLTSTVAGVAFITLNRPEKRNALDRASIAALSLELERCARDEAVRAVQITGAGQVFCAGADLGEMQAQRQAGAAQNLADAEQLASMLWILDSMPKPTLARVNGDGYGGALGLLAACDIVVVAREAKFAFTEARLGIIPAVISPFVLGKMGESAARRYFLTCETLTAADLEKLGLAHEVVPADQLDPCCARIIEALLKGAPHAQAEAKTLIRDVAHASARNRSAAALEAAARLARLRVGAEAQEGFAAYFAKRKAAWRQD
ncbi:MAG TPA: enoyl-CoA hydratase-related protein [Steroidobacteraceae bacterium]|jgi:methylglutaconyl-CoA hydratase|nr:enoyl-CoA hydratase-related protein [Steroidobacteraceae bacterium]